MDSMMLLTVFLNASDGSIGVLVGIGVGSFLGTAEGRERLVDGSRLEVYDTVGLISEEGENLGRAVPPAVGAGMGEA